MINNITLGDKIIVPSKILCVGRNYVEHIAELGNELSDEMVLFMKPNSSIGSRLIAFQQEAIHYEAELCFLYENNQFSAISIGLDLTKRVMQSKLKQKGLPWERAKAFDHSALFGNFVYIEDMTNEFSLELEVNDALIQAGSVNEMIYKPTEILKEIQSFMTLNNGDIVMTGTPKGVGIVNVGDQFCGRVMQAGRLLTEAHWIAQ